MEQVKAHPFFHDVDWAGLRDGKAPFIPALDSEIECVVLLLTVQQSLDRKSVV